MSWLCNGWSSLTNAKIGWGCTAVAADAEIDRVPHEFLGNILKKAAIIKPEFIVNF